MVYDSSGGNIQRSKRNFWWILNVRYNNDEEIYKYWRYKLKSTEFNFIINSSNLFHSFLSNFFFQYLNFRKILNHQHFYFILQTN